MTRNLTVASFDIGKYNFAFCVESIPILNFINSNVHTVDLIGHLELIDNISLLTNKAQQRSISYSFDDLYAECMSRMHIWDKCTIFLIEQQYDRNKIANKIQNHLEAFLKINYPFRQILFISPRRKTFGVTGLNYKNRKKYCIDNAMYILQNRNDTATIEILKKFKKKDDICDTICQLSSWKKHLLLRYVSRR